MHALACAGRQAFSQLFKSQQGIYALVPECKALCVLTEPPPSTCAEKSEAQEEARPEWGLCSDLSGHWCRHISARNFE